MADGRTYDLQTLPLNDAADGVVTGVLKLAQWWGIAFCTETGSVKFNPTYGCDFPRLLRDGELATENSVRSAFGMAALALASQIPKGPTPDEQLDKVTLLSVSGIGNNLILRIEFKSLAGTAREVQLPVRYTQAVAL